MEEACDIMQLPWVFRKAVLLLNTVQVCSCQAEAQLLGSMQCGQYKHSHCQNLLELHILHHARHHTDKESNSFCTRQIVENDDYFRTAAKVGGILDIVEQYPFDGSYVKHNRRDKRRGQHSGRVVRSPEAILLE